MQNNAKPPDEFNDVGPIYFCLVNGIRPDCDLHLYRKVNADVAWYSTPYYLRESKIVYADPNGANPRLLVQADGPHSGDGDCWIATALYRYDGSADRFVRVYLNQTGHNNNQATRFAESGPLQGDIIVNDPTMNAPYGYWIEVYRANNAGEYKQVLRYRSRTRYNDGNPLAAIDSEMPAILGHFNLWKPGDPLPVPPHMPTRCHQLSISSGEEW